MRQILMAAALLLSSTLGAARAGPDEGPQIVDPAYDVNIVPAAFLVGLPWPSVDLRAVTFSRDAADMRVRFEVTDIDFGVEGPLWSQQALAAYWDNDDYGQVVASSFESRCCGWKAVMYCEKDGRTVCQEVLEDPVLDPATDSLWLRIPLSLMPGIVKGPRAFSHIGHGDCGCEPGGNVAFQDFAPNEGRGTDFDPGSE